MVTLAKWHAAILYSTQCDHALLELVILTNAGLPKSGVSTRNLRRANFRLFKERPLPGGVLGQVGWAPVQPDDP